MTHPLRALAFLLATVFFVSSAVAQDVDRRVRFDIERYRPAVDGTAGFAVSDPRGLQLGEFALSLNLNNAFSPLVLKQADGERADLISNRFGGTLSGLFGVGFKGMLSVGVDIPFILYQSGSFSALPPSTSPTLDARLGAVAMGDLRVTPRVAILREGKDGVDLAVDASLVLPTGDRNALFGDSGVGGSVAVTVGRSVEDFRLLGQVGARLRSSNDESLAPIGSELLLRGAAIYNLNLGSEFYIPRQIIGELDAGTMFSSMFSGSSTPAEWRLGARFCAIPNLAVTAGGGGGLSPAAGTPFARLNIGVAWDPRACVVVDTDGDGIPDDEDECPTVPGVPEERGCPAVVVDEVVDTDGDGIPDDEDECPEVPGVAEFNGCPAPDRDGDGIPDSEDKCPDEPGVAEFEGCPPPSDRDGDGVIDDEDECPDEAGPAENKGCPWGDADGDGLLDNVDECPNEAGPEENNGCPWPDADGDGVPDHEDNCPNEAGPVENHGCKVPQIVVIRKERIEILEEVHFATGSAVIDKRSFNLLDQVAAVIREHSVLKKIRVEGHTDNVGSAESNMKLSQDRADSVRDYLIGQNVDASRLEAVGYGQDKPIAPNITRRGRDANRRVEFSIIDDGRSKRAEPVEGADEGTLELELEPTLPVVVPAPSVKEKPAPVVVPTPPAKPEPAPIVDELQLPLELEPAPVAEEEQEDSAAELEELPLEFEPPPAAAEETPEEEAFMGFDDALFDLPPLPEE